MMETFSANIIQLTENIEYLCEKSKLVKYDLRFFAKYYKKIYNNISDSGLKTKIHEKVIELISQKVGLYGKIPEINTIRSYCTRPEIQLPITDSPKITLEVYMLSMLEALNYYYKIYYNAMLESYPINIATINQLINILDSNAKKSIMNNSVSNLQI